MPSPAKRGDILDRRGRVLATSVDADTIYAVPSAIDDAGDGGREAVRRARRLHDHGPRRTLAERLGQTARVRVRPAAGRRRIRRERVAALNLDGIGFMKESRRFYPNKELAAHLLGYVGLDNNGLSGLESTYDSQIRGKAGTVLVQTDARRHAFSRFERPPTTGSTIELTIDEYLQHIAERELHAGVVANRAAGGTAIIMNPHTGEILAMANEPTFNPNAYREFDEAERRNRAVQDLYEPGSTFKVVTASAAIEEKVMPIDTLIDTNPGVDPDRSTRGRPTMRGHNYGVLSFTDVIVKSSNVGAIKIGFRVGTERLSRLRRAVRLRPSGVARLSRREPRHRVERRRSGPTARWRRCRWAIRSASRRCRWWRRSARSPTAASTSSRASSARSIATTAATQVAAEGRAPDDQRRHRGDADDIMEGVVERRHGEARADSRLHDRRQDRHRGEARSNGRYSTSDYNASFVGFLPSRNPAVAIIVVIDSPHGRTATRRHRVRRRSSSASPRRRCAISASAPTINPAPPVLVARRDDRSTSRGRRRAAPRIAGRQPGRRRPPGTVPDLRGMSARDAVRTAGQARADARACRATASSCRRIRRRARRSTATACAASTLERCAVAPRRDASQP